jgi:hypothetical protein
LLPLFLFWHRLCFSWLLWVLGPSSLSLSLVFRASLHYPFSSPLVLCCVACFWLRTVFVRRVQGLTSLSCFSELNLSLLWFFFSSLFLCLFSFFWGFPWLVGFFGLLVRLYIGSSSQFRFRSHLSPECCILLQLQNPTYRYWCCLLAVSASVGTGVLLLCILFVFTEIALVQSGSHLCWGPPYLLLSLPLLSSSSSSSLSLYLIFCFVLILQ